MAAFPVDITVNGTLNILMLSFLLYQILINTTLNKKITNAYILTIVLTVLVIIAEILTCMFDGLGAAFRIPNMIANIVGFTLSTCIPVGLAMVFDKKISQKMIMAISVPILVNFMISLLSPWTGWIFHVSLENQYTRGPLFFVYVLTYVFCFLVLMVAIYRNSKRFQNKNPIFLFFLFLIVIVGTSIQVLYPYLHTTWHCITLVLVMYYLYLRELQFKYDVTTNMLNRSAFDKELERLEKAGCASIVMLDLDAFKRINDTYGHLQGDYCLETVAQIIRDSFKKSGMCYRIGGDEFCVLINHTDEAVIRACVSLVEKGIIKAKKSNPIIPSVSFGYSIYEKSDNGNILTALKRADENMYDYKKQKTAEYQNQPFL